MVMTEKQKKAALKEFDENADQKKALEAVKQDGYALRYIAVRKILEFVLSNL